MKLPEKLEDLPDVGAGFTWWDSEGDIPLCPHCGWNSYYNSWGDGNACCAKCGKEFNVVFQSGNGLVGLPLENKP